MSSHDAVRKSFAETADERAAAVAAGLDELRDRVRRFLTPAGDERVLDAGTGAGALALALAPLVGEVVGVDLVPQLLDRARELGRDAGNVTFVEGDIAHLPFDRGEFDLAATRKTLHHVPRPELVMAELTRVTRLGGRILVVDQVAPTDPLAAIELDRFERARDPSHTRLLPDADMRALFEMNGLVVLRAEILREPRHLEGYLDLAGVPEEERGRVRGLAPADPYVADVGWYLARR